MATRAVGMSSGRLALSQCRPSLRAGARLSARTVRRGKGHSLSLARVHTHSESSTVHSCDHLAPMMLRAAGPKGPACANLVTSSFLVGLPSSRKLKTCCSPVAEYCLRAAAIAVGCSPSLGDRGEVLPACAGKHRGVQGRMEPQPESEGECALRASAPGRSFGGSARLLAWSQRDKWGKCVRGKLCNTRLLPDHHAGGRHAQPGRHHQEGCWERAQEGHRARGEFCFPALPALVPVTDRPLCACLLFRRPTVPCPGLPNRPQKGADGGSAAEVVAGSNDLAQRIQHTVDMVSSGLVERDTEVRFSTRIANRCKPDSHDSIRSLRRR